MCVCCGSPGKALSHNSVQVGNGEQEVNGSLKAHGYFTIMFYVCIFIMEDIGVTFIVYSPFFLDVGRMAGNVR